MKKLSISIDMGAKYNGVFIIKTNDKEIIDKKAKCIIINKSNVNFSKVSRRANRHKVRNIKRRKLAKRLLWEIIDKKSFTKEQQEAIQGLLNNRGYTYLSTSSEFEQLQDETFEFMQEYFTDLKDLKTKDDFLMFLSDDNFDNEKELLDFLDNQIENLDREYKKRKSDFYKEFKESHDRIKIDLKALKEFFTDIKSEILTGSKPRKKYLNEIKDEIKKYDFIKDKESFFNLIGNISNLQLRVLRKYFNNKFDDSFDDKKLHKKLSGYFKRFQDKDFKAQVLKIFNKTKSSKNFLKTCTPYITIPPYEDMNNRDSCKCNSMLIKEEAITGALRQSIETLLKEDAFKIVNGDNLTYPQKLQRILDINSKIIKKEIYPRNVFKHQKESSDIRWYQNLLGENFDEFSRFAKRYYSEEDKIIKGIYNDNFLFKKCNQNTPHKNNIKHTLLKPIYSYEFSKEEVDKLIEDIKKVRGLQASLKRVSEEAKNYQNSFYHIIEACFNNEKCIEDKNIKVIVKNLDKNLQDLKAILKDKDTYLSTIEKIDTSNLKRVLNIFKQTYEILFKDLSGFNKTCKSCTIENNIRSDENNAIAKRLLSDVAKPIDGMLDMILDRISWDIVKDISKDDIKDINNLEIILEQNRFEFEENLIDIKKSSNNQIKQKKREYKDSLDVDICPYTGKKFTKGDWDHILPRSKEIFNSKANLIYCSPEGNRDIKKNQDFALEMINKEHLKAVFGKDKSLDDIKEDITKGVDSIEIDKFTNFDNLKLYQQKALRYALFLKGTKTFKKALKIIKQDKIKTISNGTQKRLARKINEKLNMKFPNEMKTIDVNVKVIDNKEVSATRKELSVNKETGEINHLFKEDIQDTHSHCIDAMVAFYLANKEFDFDKIYINQSAINQVKKSKTFINSKDIKSFKLFQDTIYSENYEHFTKDDRDIDILISHNLLYINKNGKKNYINDKNQIETISKIDKTKLSNLLFEAFEKKNEVLLKKLKFLDKKRFITVRKNIKDIFFPENKLVSFEEIEKNIPPYQEKTYKAVYEVLKDMKEFDENIYKEKMTNFYKLQKRKRNKKRHIFSLPSTGQNAKFRVRRGDKIAVLGSENIATKTYLVDNNLVQIPFFSKNVIPLKIEDMLKALKLNKNSKALYAIKVDIKEIEKYVQKLLYFLTEKSRLTIEVTLNKDAFDINFDHIKEFDGKKDEEFEKFLQNYIQNRESILYKYIGSIRDGLKGKAMLLDKNKESITLQYKADTNSFKKEIILSNI